MLDFKRHRPFAEAITMEDFLKNMADALNQSGAEFTPEQKLQDLPNWDSLAILTTLSMIDQEYGVMMSGAELQACNSLSDLYAKVEELKSQD
jgi:acyl carrier protein